MDMVVIPAACDGKKKLGEALSAWAPTHVMQLPASKTAPGARELWLRSCQTLLERAEKLTGKKVTRENLKSAIIQLNDRVKAFRRFFQLRRSAPPVITGEDALFVTGASFLDDPARWTKEVLALWQELVASRLEGRFVRPADAPRILLTGAPLIYPNFKLARIIESVGAVIAIDELCSGTQRLYNPVVPKDWTMKEMLVAVADKHLLPCTCPCFVESADRINRLLELVEEFAIDGVVYHNLRMCQLHDVESFGIKTAFAKRDIPLLIVHSDYSHEDTPQLRTRTQAFLEMISERGRVPVPR
jgi:benzoyl-CoA reductase/2-hydroxyglutaryl-CoA dehydratase subunit BcrC/BadD/HgdB